jgi:sulfur carrier protein ThiS
MIAVYVKAIGHLTGQAHGETPVTLPRGASLQDLLDKLGIRSDEIMLAFINDGIAKPSSPLTHECRVHLSPFICGG